MNVHNIQNLVTAFVKMSLCLATSVFANQVPVIVNPDGQLTYIVASGANDSWAVGINDTGQVLGYPNMGDAFLNPFITGPNGVGMSYLGTLEGAYNFAAGINNAGQVVGTITPEYDPSSNGYISGPNGMGLKVLGTPGDSIASAINNAGQVVGFTSHHTFITGPNGVGMTALPDLDRVYSITGINAAGRVVGNSEHGNSLSRAFITGPNGVGLTALDSLGGNSTSASAINNAGQVVGSSSLVDGSYHAFITGPNGVGITDLGALGGNDTFATAVNDAGQVAGYSNWADGSSHAFVTGPNGVGMTDLQLLLVSHGVVTSSAVGINNLGQVLADTRINTSMVPELSSYALMLAGLGLVGFMVRRRESEQWGELPV
jgi:probable HAF family extracellular repeat protein